MQPSAGLASPMNTVLCDWPDSEPADILGPVMLWWLEVVHPDFRVRSWYHERVISDDDDTDWCLSEILDGWLQNNLPSSGFDVHEGCPWQ